MTKALCVGEVVMIATIALLHKGLTSGQVAMLCVAANVIGTASMMWIEEMVEKCRDAWRSNHGGR